MGDQLNPAECPHPYADFCDVVFSEQFQYEQRYLCMHCPTMIHFQMGPFGIILGRREVPHWQS